MNNLATETTKVVLYRKGTAYSLDNLMENHKLNAFLWDLEGTCSPEELDDKVSKLPIALWYNISSDTLKFGFNETDELVMESFIEGTYDKVGYVMNIMDTFRIVDVAKIYKMVHKLASGNKYSVEPQSVFGDNELKIDIPTKFKFSEDLELYDELLTSIAMVPGFELEFKNGTKHEEYSSDIKKLIIKTDGKHFTVKFKS